MRILILGGTAFLSAEIARQAVAEGHQVSCLARGNSQRPPDGATWLSADRTLGTDAYAAAAAEEWDAVVEVARDPVFAAGALESLADRAAHWTFVSTSSVYADHSVPQEDESASLLPPLAAGTPVTAETYGAAKAAIEAATLAATGGRAHVCRAGLISGPGDPTDRYGYWPARFARDNQPAFIPDIAYHPTQIIDVRDLAAWILAAAGRGVTGALNAMGDPVPFGAYLQAARQLAGYTGNTRTASEDFLLAHGVEYWAGPDSLPLWLPPQHDGFMNRSNHAAIVAGLELRPWQETLAATLEFERGIGLDRPRKAGLDAAREKELLEALSG
ncbi:NAD dependent epimerase/dehydratase family protein [Arthrobacter ulcerisalmonis]|uniref:NAD dependent epimerase/dehydratase family protein n=1 Tax=Arthrobacter ulcerisalmonis TaxID=2483813 RepID=A0A3P5XTG0_9MICC|nr:NAD-dependent epimerase/dehydratase family protein [Arthrobacter ulcerisalmonis]VDC32320.1 NAD dependent epimerase/dehydratase family protein [Arthrobacter ulcerisalmonis]